ncbi:MAG: phosphoenolpyruvate--protein phosphotransferase [Verrucomicrobia bacterium]|nr:phosphoenolpyruvate--protein phosphotransferase [Verrucomicrobiota bacterium]
MPASLQMETKLKGLALSEGYAIARVCMFNEHRHSSMPSYRIEAGNADAEIARVQEAIKAAAKRLNEIRDEVAERIGPAEAEIFVAQRMILEDQALDRDVAELIRRDLVNAETAVAHTLDAYEARMRDMKDAYIRERASEFGEIKHRLLDVLGNMRLSFVCSGDEHCQRGRNRVVVAKDLTPSLTVEIDTRHVMGFVTERGGKNSHAAILARAIGVPAVSGISDVLEKVGCGTEILVNGNNGEVVIWPSESTIMQVQASEPAHKQRVPVPVDPVAGFKVMANINTASDVTEALSMRAEGVGLYRTEIEVIAEGRLLSEDELFERYSSVVKALGGHAVVFRAFDLGSDKSLPFMPIPPEENPSLGWRGTRLLLGRMDLLRTQARALVRASVGSRLDVMYPMIVDKEQFLAVKQAFNEVTADLERGDIRHGVMFEVPSACLEAKEIYKVADFGSIGTNDLTQYLFAVDRDNELVAADFNPDKPALWNLITSVLAASKESGKPLSICGELAGDPKFIGRLMDLGFETVSVSSRRISVVRAAAMARQNRTT